MIKGYIYCHISPSGKRYIGQTTASNPKYRWSGKNPYMSNRYFSAAILEYGWENFSHEILEEHSAKCKEDVINILNEREAILIEQYNTLAPNGYNIKPGGSNSCHSEETKQLLREKNLGKVLSQETKDKIAEASRNQEWTQERRDNISTALKGRNLGPEFATKISEALKGNQNAKGHILSEESKAKMRATKKVNGTDRWTDKHRETIKRKQEKGELHWTLDEEARSNISKGRKGIKFSDEHRKHISEAQKGKPKPSSKYKHTKEQAQKAWKTRIANGNATAYNKGKIAITDGNNVRYINSTAIIPDGWRKGNARDYKTERANNIWVNDGIYAYWVSKDVLSEYLAKGYMEGKNKLKSKNQVEMKSLKAEAPDIEEAEGLDEEV